MVLVVEDHARGAHGDSLLRWSCLLVIGCLWCVPVVQRASQQVRLEAEDLREFIAGGVRVQSVLLEIQQCQARAIGQIVPTHGQPVVALAAALAVEEGSSGGHRRCE